MSPTDSVTEAGLVLDDFHDAAAKADGDRYFGHFTPDGVFIGTDAGERWTVETFRAYAEPHFSKGKGWSYTPRDRHIALSADGGTAWFDEKLDNDKYGEARGSGVLVRTDRWRIAHYVLSFPVPNDKAADVIALIRGEEKEPNMKRYFMGFLYRGPAWSYEQTEASIALGKAHMANIDKLAAEGKLLIAGPFEQPEGAPAQGPLAGIFLLEADTLAEAEALMSTDPAIAAGRFTIKVLPWWGPTGLTYDGAPH
jgi:uncharacterized protein YciI